MSFWLVKSEEAAYSISDLSRDKETLWDGVRNYQARNYLRAMQPGDLVLYYHSNCEQIGVAGMARVAAAAVPDKLQFDKRSAYFDPKATPENPRWFAPRLSFEKRFSVVLTLEQLKKQPKLKKMPLLQRGSRLSVQPVSAEEFKVIASLAK